LECPFCWRITAFETGGETFTNEPYTGQHAAVVAHFRGDAANVPNDTGIMHASMVIPGAGSAIFHDDVWNVR
jgi:hypothetical protein